MTSHPAVSLRHLTKRYRQHAAVDDLTVEIPAGVVVGVIGPNGAGKTTTLAALLGLVRPTSGGGTVLGAPLDRPDRYLHRVGALIEGPALWAALTAYENLEVLARLAGHDRARIPAVLDTVGLTERASDRVRTYSLGMRQRLGIAAALLGDPELLVLDEPTNGLDPAGITAMRDLVAALGRGDRTVLVSSHLLSELEHVADWLVVIADGRLVHAGPSTSLGGRVVPEITLGAADDAHLPDLAQLVAAAGCTLRRDGDRLVVTADGHEPRRLAAQLNALAARAGIVLAELHVAHPTLEAAYLDLVQGATR